MSSSSEELHDIDWADVDFGFDYTSSSVEFHDIDLEDPDACFDYTDGHHNSPQHKAVIDNDLETLKELLKSGKSPNAIDNSRYTPLHFSIMNDRKDIFDYLLSVEDIRLDVADFIEMTPLMRAVIHKRDYYAIELIRCGADLDYQQIDGKTALHLTVIENSTKVAVELLEHGADVNCQNFSGETPLHIAVENSNNDFVHILLYYGAIATIYDDDGLLPFSRCFQHCPDYLQDILFDMTFDNYKIKLKLFTFLSPMIKSSDIFYKILEKTSELIYGVYDLECLHRDLFQMKANMVKILFLKFPQLFEDLRNPLSNCVHFLDSHMGDTSDTIELIYFFCENLNERLEFSTNSLISSLIHCKLPESTLSELVCTFLSYGFDLTTRDLNMVYVTYGYGELFKILIHMRIEEYNNMMRMTIPMPIPMPMIIYDVQLISSFSGIPKVVDDDVRRRTSKFFTIDFGIVPSLLQLSRDVARKHLIKSYKIRDNIQFFTLLKWLPISKIYKAILSLEQEIYPTQNQPIEYSCTQ